VQSEKIQSHGGTTDFFFVFSAVPAGLGHLRNSPGVETPGYFQMSRRDNHFTLYPNSAHGFAKFGTSLHLFSGLLLSAQ
jgi:hypothetical protein